VCRLLSIVNSSPTREHAKWEGTRSVEWTEEEVRAADCIVISTRHKSIDYQQLANWADMVIDTRNAMAGVETKPGQVVKA